MKDKGKRTKDKGLRTKNEAKGKESSFVHHPLSFVLCPFPFVLFPLSFVLCTSLSGCVWDKTWDQLNFMKSPPPPPPPVESFVLRGDKLEEQKLPEQGTPEGDLAGAKELFRQSQYAKAEKVFHHIAEDKHNATQLAEEARYYEAECLRLQGNLPRAADTYTRMLNDFQSGAYREQAVQHMFEIANLWLDDTRQEMVETREMREGKRWIVLPHFVHIDKGSPFLDKEGRALEVLEQVRYNDMTGPLADKALFLGGSVKFFNEEYKESDLTFTQLVEMYPNSPFAAQAVELAIISKHMSTGGADYDGRKVAEARELVKTALRSYPQIAKDDKKREFLDRQLQGITLQQAEKDYKMADFWERTGHEPSAYFYYQIVRQRYPGTKYFEMATERMHAIKAKAEKSNAKLVDAPKGVPEVPAPARPDVQAGQPSSTWGAPNNVSEPKKLPASVIRN
ncbi:MAG: tetratricopeptide repeat protein [Gemmataceae bacterium]